MQGREWMPEAQHCIRVMSQGSAGPESNVHKQFNLQWQIMLSQDTEHWQWLIFYFTRLLLAWVNRPVLRHAKFMSVFKEIWDLLSNFALFIFCLPGMAKLMEP